MRLLALLCINLIMLTPVQAQIGIQIDLPVLGLCGPKAAYMQGVRDAKGAKPKNDSFAARCPKPLRSQARRGYHTGYESVKSRPVITRPGYCYRSGAYKAGFRDAIRRAPRSDNFAKACPSEKRDDLNRAYARGFQDARAQLHNPLCDNQAAYHLGYEHGKQGKKAQSQFVKHCPGSMRTHIKQNYLRGHQKGVRVRKEKTTPIVSAHCDKDVAYLRGVEDGRNGDNWRHKYINKCPANMRKSLFSAYFDGKALGKKQRHSQNAAKKPKHALKSPKKGKTRVACNTDAVFDLGFADGEQGEMKNIRFILDCHVEKIDKLERAYRLGFDVGEGDDTIQ